MLLYITTVTVLNTNIRHFRTFTFDQTMKAFIGLLMCCVAVVLARSPVASLYGVLDLQTPPPAPRRVDQR